MIHPNNSTSTDGCLARSSGVRLRRAAGLLFAFIALFAVSSLPGGGDLAHAQEPAITVGFEDIFEEYSESAGRGRRVIQARTAGSVPPAQDFTVTVVSGDLSAVAGEDYSAVSATLAFRASDFVLENGRYVNSVEFEFHVHADDIIEKRETFELVIQSTGLPPHVTLDSQNDEAVIALGDDSGTATVTVAAPREVNEGEAFDVILSVDREIAFPWPVVFGTVDGTALGDSDYEHSTQVLELQPGQRRKSVRVSTIEDNLVEEDEQFEIHLVRNALDASIVTPGNPAATITIKDNDATPGAPGSPRVSSGDGKVIVQWLPPRNPGNTHGLRYEYRLEAEFFGNSWIEIPDSGPGGANHGRYEIARPNGSYTIVYLRARNAWLTGHIVHRGAMPHAGAPGAPGNFRGEAVSHREVRLSWREPAARSGVTILAYDVERSHDGRSWPDSSQHPPGTTSVTTPIGENQTRYYRIRTIFDAGPAGDPFSRGFSPTSPAVRISTMGEGLLGLLSIGVSDGLGREGLDTDIAFDVWLNRPAASTVTVRYLTRNITARAGSDYTRTSGTLIFAPGETAKMVSVPIIDDTVEDSGEEFALLLRNVSGAHLARAGGIGTIYNSETPAEELEPAADAGEQTETQAAAVDPPAPPLMASLQGMPAEHDGESVFTFGLTFSEAPKLSYKVLRDRAFDVTGGVVRKAQRRQQGSNLGWTITVEPAGGDDVSIALPGGRACTAYGAVCTADGRILANTVSTLVRGPAALSVADARTGEAAGATLAFAVTLSRAASDTVTVDYATSDGTATAGADYTHASGTLTFAAGETRKTVTVAVLDDPQDDGGETLTLTLSNPSGAVFADAQASGVIENTDPLQRAWLARFGRAAAEHVMEAVGARIEGSSSGSTRLTLGGRPVPLDASWTAEEATPTSRTKERDFGRLLTEGHAGLWREGDDDVARAATMSELLRGSSFHLASAATAEQGPRWSLWGRGAHASFNGADGGLSLDGDVSTGMVGADYESGKMLVGVALSYSAGEGSYRMADAKGRLESTLASAHPYLRYAVSERLSLWGVVGLGRGELRIDPERSQERLEADLSTAMAAAGVRGGLTSAAGYDLAWKSDVLFVRSESDAAQGLAAAEAETRRVRLALEAARDVKLGDGVLRPSLEAGLRYDGGDAETGSGVELGGALRYSGSGGLTMEVRARGLLAHEQRGYEEWGVSSSVSFTSGEGGRGLSIRAGSSWGAASGGADRLWSQPTAAALVRNEDFEPGAASFEAEVGYGLDVMGGLLTPFSGLSVSEGGQTYRVGGRFKLEDALTMSLEGHRRETGRETKPVHGIVLRLSLRW